MKSLERRFQNIKKRNPLWSSYVSFAEAVSGQNFSKRIITRWFNILVPTEEYSTSAKKDLLTFLTHLTDP